MTNANVFLLRKKKWFSSLFMFIVHSNIYFDLVRRCKCLNDLPTKEQQQCMKIYYTAKKKRIITKAVFDAATAYLSTHTY